MADLSHRVEPKEEVLTTRFDTLIELMGTQNRLIEKQSQTLEEQKERLQEHHDTMKMHTVILGAAEDNSTKGLRTCGCRCPKVTETNTDNRAHECRALEDEQT